MNHIKSTCRLTVVLASVAVALLSAQEAAACGGFFCQLIPIDQAGEQIIFRQEGDQVTAVVLIQYEGEAEDFSWVVPVPGIPQLSTGSDLLFAPLELATRPQFVLETTGAACPQPRNDLDFTGGFGGPSVAPGAEDDGVDILETLAVGPFDVQIVSSDDAEALATWLADNNYDLTDRGRELIEPYVTEGMNFVALKLRQDQGVGDIEPLIMHYKSDQPMIPIRLTAVAALPDMGVIVWLLGDARAVPINYLHVKPNYTRLNWYAGSLSAYTSYQGLITAAMDEAGGKGFATDYAGRNPDLLQSLPSVDPLNAELDRLAGLDDANFVAQLASNFVFPQTKTLEILRRQLPLPAGNDEFIYQIPELVSDVFTAEQLASARTAIVSELSDGVVAALEESLAVFDGNPYLTRLYTTLSAEDMTLDPCFSFNPDLEDQSLERRATLHVACTLTGTKWTLTLGPGTGRDGVKVIDGTNLPPSFQPPTIEQDAVWRTETVTTSGPPSVVTQKQFGVAQVTGENGGGGAPLCGAGTGLCGTGILGMLGVMMLGLRLMRSRRS